MFDSISASKSISGGTTTVVLIDKCMGAMYFAKPNPVDVYASFVLFVISFYEKNNIYPNQNILRCLRYLRNVRGLNLDYIADAVELHWKRICPNINITNKYLPLIRQVFIPIIEQE